MTAIIFVAAGIFLGLYQSLKLKKREEALTEILRFLEEMSVQIHYRILPVEQLIAEMSGGRFRFLDSVYEKLNEQKSIDWRTAWEDAAKDTNELNAEDRELLISVGKQLGTSDVAGQLAMFELNKALFSSRLAGASEENLKKSKMYRSVGLFAGLGAAAIIL